MTVAGQLRERLTFQGRKLEDDGFGNMVPGSFGDRFTCAASLRILRGSETVIAGALQGTQALVAFVRYNANAMKDVDNTWRLKDTRTTNVYSIQSFEPDEKRQYARILLKRYIGR